MIVIPPMEWPTRTTGPGPGTVASITALRSAPSWPMLPLPSADRPDRPWSRWSQKTSRWSLRSRRWKCQQSWFSVYPWQKMIVSEHRLVFWDQRDHGRSGRSAEGSGSIGQLGADLKAVIDATAPGAGPVVLVGHSMGGMTIMALADQYPELFGTKVAGAVLISTAARGLEGGSPWMPAPLRPALARALPSVLNGAAKGRRAILVERGRRVSGDLAFLTTRLIGFVDGDVSPATVMFLEQMIRATPIEVVARFGQALLNCDMRDSLATLGRVPVTVIVGEKDRLIAAPLGIELATQIPGAQLVWVPGAGHALILECPELVNKAITDLLARVAAGGLPRSA